MAAAQWAGRVDAACQRATAAIIKRGWPDDLRELRTVGPEAAADLRAAITDVRRLPLPTSDATSARLFVAALRALEPMLDDVTRASTAMDLKGLGAVTLRLEGKLMALHGSAKRAGFRRCLPPEHATAAVDAIRAPLAAEQIARLNRRLSKRLKATAFGTPRSKLRRTRAAVHAHWVALGTVKAPGWAYEQLAEYASAARRFREALDILAERMRRGSLPTVREIGRVLNPAAAQLTRASRQLTESLGAIPVSRAAPGERS